MAGSANTSAAIPIGCGNGATRPRPLEAEQARLQSAVGDPAFYQQAANKITTTLARLEAVTQELETCYARWEVLESPLTAADG